MKKTVLRVLSYVLVAVVAAGITAGAFLLTRKNDTGKLQELQTILDKYFIGEMNMEDLEDAAASAMVQALGDRWSNYKTAEAYLAYKETVSNSYVGVGLTVQAAEEGQGLEIVEVAENGGAKDAGILPGDRLVAVNGESILEMDTDSITLLIRGEEGTTVELTVVREEIELCFTVERRRIQTAVATGQMLEGNIGLVTIENFDERCAQEATDAIKDLQERGAKALIFDVRNNPGGYKRELVKILDYLLPEGEVFRTEDYSGKVEVDYSDSECLDIPMAVLINGNSYSAAEFFAAALEEYGVAITVGEKTTGKGYYQQTMELEDGSAVTLSVGKYFTPKGKSLAGVGLTPKIESPVDEETFAEILYGILPPEEDPQIQAAINALNGGN